MTIGMDISAIGERNTGTSRYIRCLHEQLIATGHDIPTFPAHPLGHVTDDHWLRSIPIVRRGGIYRHAYRLLRQSKEMNAAGVEYGIFPNYLKPLAFEKPSLIVLHDLSFLSHPQFYSKAFVLFYRDQLRRILKTNPLVATDSEHSREQIRRFLHVPEDRIFLLQPYVDPARFPGPSMLHRHRTGRPYFLYVGHIEPRKNLGFLIRNFLAWKSVNRIEIGLKIVGDVWLKSPETRELLDRYKQSPDVEFTGYVDEDRLHALYAQAAGFVHTSFVEGFGFPVLEALAYRLPVLCSAGTSTEEISHPYAVAVDPQDDAALKAGFDRLFCRSGAPLSAGAVPYSPELMRHQLMGILERLTGRKIHAVGDVSKPEVETAVERTLLYYKLFDGGIRGEALHAFLLDLEVTPGQLDHAVCALIDRGIVSCDNATLCLKADICPFYVRKPRSLDGERSRQLLAVLRALPFITAIAFSGGTANYGLDRHDDIDLFIVTKPFTVYLVYLMIHVISLVTRSRHILCINYLVDEQAAEITINRDLYTAHQIIALKSYKNDHYLRHFLHTNAWVTHHYPNFPMPGDNGYRGGSIVYALFRPINWALRMLYRRWYRITIQESNESSIVLSEHVMKLHTRDYRAKVISEFETRWQEYRRRNDAQKVSLSR